MRRITVEQRGSRWSSGAVSLILACFCSGCGSLTDRAGSVSRVNPHTIAAYHADQEDFYHNREGQVSCPLVRPYNDSNYGAIDLDCYRFPEQTADDVDRTRISGATAYTLAVGDINYRNRLVSILIKQSDNICTLEMGRFTSVSSLTNAGLGIATTALAGVATIVTGNTAKTILSGVATITSGARDHINAEIYQHQVSQAIGHAILEQRQKLLTEIEGHFKEDKVVWPIDAAILDVDRYHQECSLYRGLDLVISAVDKQGSAQPDSSKQGVASKLTTDVFASMTSDLEASNNKLMRDMATANTSAEKRSADLKQIGKNNDIIDFVKKTQSAQPGQSSK